VIWHPDMPDSYKNQIVTGDARILSKRIPDESIDLIFTDPVYDRIEDYEWLAEVAIRILKNDSSALVACSIPLIAKSAQAMGVMNFKWVLGGFMPGRRNLYYRIMSKWFPFLWMTKGNGQPRRVVFDMSSVRVWGSKLPDAANSHFHAWQKPIDWLALYLDAFCSEDGIIFDPFTGGASIPAVCKMLGRNYIAFEIDPEVAELARERVRNTQPPLFVMKPEQLELPK